MHEKWVAIISNMPLLKKLHISIAAVIVAIATINAGITGFVVVGLWMASSFSEKTRWLFYGLLLVQAWSNWHVIGLILSIVFIAFCVNRNIAYRKLHPAPPAWNWNPFYRGRFAGIISHNEAPSTDSFYDKHLADQRLINDLLHQDQLEDEQNKRDQELFGEDKYGRKPYPYD